MAESTTTPSRPGGEAPAERPRVRHGQTNGRLGSGAVLFPPLVLAHYRYFAFHARFGESGGIPSSYAPEGETSAAPRGAKAEARKEYEEALESFEASAGRITNAYWCVVAPSAVALTEGPRHRVWRFLWQSEPELRLHRESDWLTNAYPDISILLHHCDTIALKASAVLRGTAKRIALESAFTEEKFLLAAAEERRRCEERAAADGATDGSRAKPRRNGGGSPPNGNKALPQDKAVTHARDVLVELEKYYDRAGNRAARIVYFWGMVAGVAVALALAAFFALLVHLSFLEVDVDQVGVRSFFVCYAAGALGAVVSVLIRMRRDDGFSLDYEVGRSQSFRLGSFRPFLGAVFGLLIYFALESGLLQIAVPDRDPTTDATDVSLYFLAFISFVAGFSERLAHVVLGSAERTVAATLEMSDESEESAKPTESQSLASELELLSELQQQGLLDEKQMGTAVEATMRAASSRD
jgi:hypothetical protein